MLRCAYSYLGLLLFLFILSCRSDARNLDAPTKADIEAVIAHGSLDESIKSSDLTPSMDSESNEEKEIPVPAANNTSKGSQNEGIIPAPEKVEDDIKAEVDPPKTAPTQEADSQKPTIETVSVKVVPEAVLSTIDKKSDSQETDLSSPIDNESAIDKIEEAQIVTKESTPIVANIHDAWDALLKKYVSAIGFVDYKGFKADESKIDAYLIALSSSQPKDSDLSKNAMAYYINVYNAATVKLILDNYPLASIKEINGGKPWDKVWIELGGKKYSLNNIEHDILRPRFKDERVHFAVNCASASCPKIANRAFSGSDLEALLEKLTREFVNDSKLNSIDPKAPQLSKLFQWYQGDFDNVIDFVNEYSEVKVNASAKITYKDYLWNLNGK